MPTRVTVLLAALLGAALFATPAAAVASPQPAPLASSSAAAKTKSCRSVSGRAGGVNQIRVTRSFSCREVRTTIGVWLNLFQQSGPRPWTCTYRGATISRWRCHVRTSFGGTRPLRTYRLTFRLLDA